MLEVKFVIESQGGVTKVYAQSAVELFHAVP